MCRVLKRGRKIKPSSQHEDASTCHCSLAWCLLERPVHSFVSPYLNSSEKWVGSLPALLAGFQAELSIWKYSTLYKQASFISSMGEWRRLWFILIQQLAGPEGSREQTTTNNWLQPNKGNYTLEAGGLRTVALHQREAVEVAEQDNKLQWVTEALLLPFTRKMYVTRPAQGAGCGVCHREGDLEGRGRQCLTVIFKYFKFWPLNTQLYESIPFQFNNSMFLKINTVYFSVNPLRG